MRSMRWTAMSPRLIDRAVATAREAPVPEEGALLTDVYVSY